MKTTLTSSSDSIEIIVETTDWKFPNHTYVLQGGLMIGYKKKGTNNFKLFRPTNFNKKYRTFVKAPACDYEDVMVAI